MKSINKNLDTSSGKVVASIIAASIGLLIMGVMTYTRGFIKETLTIFEPISVVGGIWFYGYTVWIISWIILYKAIGKKQKVGNMKIWVSVFFVSLVICTVFIEASLKWWLPLS